MIIRCRHSVFCPYSSRILGNIGGYNTRTLCNGVTRTQYLYGIAGNRANGRLSGRRHNPRIFAFQRHSL